MASVPPCCLTLDEFFLGLLLCKFEVTIFQGMKERMRKHIKLESVKHFVIEIIITILKIQFLIFSCLR